MRGRLLLIVVLLAVASRGGVSASQQTVPTAPTISVETSLVLLPVTVVDRHGQLVERLPQSQFSVYDNGELQPIQFFSTEEMPATVGLVIDCSSSMRGLRDQVTAAATAFAESAHPLDELFTVNFNEVVWTGLPASVVFADSVEQLHRALARAPANGMTALFDAVKRALDHLQLGTRDRKALVVVSDGGDNASVSTLAAVLEQARRTSAVIYAVLVANPDDHDARPGVLRSLARETGGDVFTPADVRGVASAFARIGQEIRSGYMIGFSPPDASGNAFRTIRVTVDGADGGKLTVRTRAGYYARPTDQGK